MADEELIKRLRDACRGGETCKCSLNEAADRIEALVRERDAAWNAAITMAAELMDARNRGSLPAHIRSPDGDAVRALLKP